jgi:hypothetical protein
MASPPRGALVLGETYFTVKCPGCSSLIPLGPNPGRSKVFRGLGILRVGCPFCGQAAEHHPNTVKTRQLKVLPPEAQ